MGEWISMYELYSLAKNSFKNKRKNEIALSICFLLTQIVPHARVRAHTHTHTHTQMGMYTQILKGAIQVPAGRSVTSEQSAGNRRPERVWGYS
jgi:hypothetical protein